MLMAKGDDDRIPDLSITIPTFRRFQMLRETVESAIAQRSSRVIEIVVVDNDPASIDADRLIAELPHVKQANFRYYRNSENIGMTGNWNRCIELGRGHWHTMLHDDDLLDPDFSEAMLMVLSANPHIDGIACQKRNLDQRKTLGEKLIQYENGSHRVLHNIKRKLIEFRRYGLSDHRRVTPQALFWGNPIGNPIGFICRKADAITIGGYDECDYPAADHLFYARFCQRFHLVQDRRAFASYRIAVNETLGEPVIRAMVLSTHRLQEEYVGTGVPLWWRHLIPLNTACEIQRWNTFWNVSIDRRAIEKEIKTILPYPRKYLYNIIRTVLGGV
jgi:glycosyltransferase involved in cell wall biosynthesis